MAKYKPYDLTQTKMIPLSYADQIVEGSFEYAVNDIIESHLDLSVFDARYANDATGRLAYDPRVLLKIVVYGYYKGIISSRTLAEACRRNVVFMALSADTRPHFTTIAAFVSELHREIASLFRDVLLFASELGLIGKEHFAVDGCKLPSNASKQWSGTHKELDEKRKKLERVAERIVLKHQQQDDNERQMPQKDAQKVERYRRKVEQLKQFLQDNDKKRGPTGNEQKANLTDPDSAKMTSSHGVIQGYNGLAVVDDKAQVVVHAEAHGTGYEAHLLAPVLEATRTDFERLHQGADIFEEVKVTADSGFHSKVVVAAIEQLKVNAYVADRDYRRRQPEFADAVRYKERRRKERALQSRREREARPPKESKLFTLKDFIYDESRALCICPAGHKLYSTGLNMLFNGFRVDAFKAPITACRGCPLREKCLRHPERSIQRQLMVFKHREGESKPKVRKKDDPTQRMRQKFDTPFGRELYSKRMGTVEPVFANLQNKGMRRFTLRGRTKVDAQWKLFTMVHNMEKIFRNAYAV